jgi:hypothetical protein
MTGAYAARMALTIKVLLEVDLLRSTDIWARKYPSPQVPAPDDFLALWHDEDPANMVGLRVAERSWNARGDEVVLLLPPLTVRGRRVYLGNEPLHRGRIDYEAFKMLLGTVGWKLADG